MKHIKLSLCLLLLIFLSFPLYGNISPRFGIGSDFAYIDLEDSDFTPDNIFSNSTYFYAGFEYLSFSLYVSVKPALKIYTTNDFTVTYENGNLVTRNENIAKITFYFEDIYLSYQGNNFGLYFGKRIFHFGEGFNRQYMFVGSSVLNNDFNALYNAEFNIYQDNITHTIGFMPDTDSIDKLEAPEYYLGWYSINYSTASLGLMGIVEYNYNVDDNDNNVKIGFETSYIFNNSIKVYGNVTYDLINKNDIGKTTENINSLIGTTYTWMYEDIIINPYLEYFYEESHSFYSIGIYASFFDSLLSVTSSFSHSPDYEMNFIGIVGLNISDQFTLLFTYNTPLNNSDEVLNIFELALEYNY